MNRILLALAFALLGQMTVSAQTDWYVDQTSILGGNGSMTNPFPTIQPAVAAAATGDTIFVLPGNYGGFIDFAGKGLNLISTGGKAVTKIRGSSTFGNSEIKIYGTSSDLARLEGFTFDSGGGTTMTVKLAASTVEVKDCEFSSQGVVVENSIVALMIDSCVFDASSIQHNVASGPATPNTGTASILNSEFKNHPGFNPDYGGNTSLQLRVSALVVDNCSFHDNGIGIDSRSTFSDIKNSTFLNHDGYGITLVAGSVENCMLDDCDFAGVLCSGPVLIRDATIQNCSINAIKTWSALVTIENSNLIDNQAIYNSPLLETQFGGGFVITNSTIARNSSSLLSSGATGFSMTGCVIAENWGGISVQGPFSLDHCTIYGNTPISGSLLSATQPSSITNTIAWANVGVLATSNFNVTSSNIQGGWSHSGSSNVDIDPLFVDALNGDLHLQAMSPMLDAAQAFSALSFDIDGEARIIGRFADIGADEFDSGTFALRGSDEDFVMIARQNFQRVNGLSVDVAGGDLISLSIESPDAAFVGSPVYVFGEVFTTGGSPILPVGHPAVHMNLMNADLLFDPALAYGLPGWSFGLPATGLSLSGPVPFGFSGVSYRVQAFAVWPTAANGWYAATDAVDLVHP